MHRQTDRQNHIERTHYLRHSLRLLGGENNIDLYRAIVSYIASQALAKLLSTFGQKLRSIIFVIGPKYTISLPSSGVPAIFKFQRTFSIDDVLFHSEVIRLQVENLSEIESWIFMFSAPNLKGRGPKFRTKFLTLDERLPRLRAESRWIQDGSKLRSITVFVSEPKYIQGATKSNPLGKIRYLWNCSRFFHQVYSVYRWGFRPHIVQILLK